MYKVLKENAGKQKALAEIEKNRADNLCPPDGEGMGTIDKGGKKES